MGLSEGAVQAPRRGKLLENKQGMVISLEPTVTFTQGGDFNICLEDDLLVTESDCENLTQQASLDLYV